MKIFKIFLIFIFMIFININDSYINVNDYSYITAPMKKENKKVKYHTIESQLSKQTKKLIKSIQKSNQKTKYFKKYNQKTYKEFVRYLNSDYYTYYNKGIHITNISKVKKRIKTVKKVNQILYKKVKKLYKGKNLKTLQNFEYFIEDKITYNLAYPDIYKSMKKGTCISYSAMLKIMCDICDIPCKIYVGWSSPWEGHCWNRVKINKKWFWVDLCWEDNTLYGDSSYLHSKKLWSDHYEYKPLSIYIISLPY